MLSTKDVIKLLLYIDVDVEGLNWDELIKQFNLNRNQIPFVKNSAVNSIEEIVNHFKYETNLYTPVDIHKDAKAYKEYQALWVRPIKEMLALTGGAIDDVMDIVTSIVKNYNANGLTISSPTSIIKTFRSEVSKKHSEVTINL